MVWFFQPKGLIILLLIDSKVILRMDLEKLKEEKRIKAYNRALEGGCTQSQYDFLKSKNFDVSQIKIRDSILPITRMRNRKLNDVMNAFEEMKENISW